MDKIPTSPIFFFLSCYNVKFVFIMGLAGTSRCDELIKLYLDDIEEKDNI
jgi:hypothetical protein